MSQLLGAIGDRIVARVRQEVAQLQADSGEYRGVFNGPPIEFLEGVFASLVGGGGISAKLANGRDVVVPVVLQVDKQRRGEANPPVGLSGPCDADHLVNLRNATNCPRYLALIPPGSVSKLTLTSARSDFGLEAHNNSGSASITDWLNDRFVHDLVVDAIRQQRQLPDDQFASARALIRHAVHAASDVDEHDSSRRGAWHVLSRVWAAGAKASAFGQWLSLACGFPPMPDGRLDADEQSAVLDLVAERLEELSVRGAINSFKEKAAASEESEALEAFGQHLEGRFATLTVLTRALPSYYAPFPWASLEAPPRWWTVLTTECWRRLLGTDDPPPSKSLDITCTNLLFPPARGLVPVVRREVKLLVRRTEETAGKTVTISRSAAGATARQWQVTLTGDQEVIDDAPPPHRTPIRYVAVAEGMKPGAARVVSLATWTPGVVLSSRTASKAELPRQPRGASGSTAALQSSMSMIGEGRHYVDVYVSPDVSLDETVHGVDESGAEEARSEYRIGKVSACEFGFEIEATSECRFDLSILRPDSAKAKIVRLLVSCEDVSPQQCKSEYERLLLLNGRRGRQGAIPDVQINRQVRSADLESWLLATDQVQRSFYPLVLGQDYVADWRQRDWRSQVDTIVSRGRFLHDPRPPIDEMVPPSAFTESRARIAARVRGEDHNGLIEAARLGEWLATDPQFANDVETYLRSYHDWLEVAPELAAWSDITLVAALEADGKTLIQEPYAILLSPLHPLRLAWHCVAQRALFLTQRKQPCPAASVLDPDAVPDCLTLTLGTASGGFKQVRFFSVECTSDYWGVLWNTGRLEKLTTASGLQPFDNDFGILVGGISSGFSVSQVKRALSDMSEMLAAQPVLNVLLTSAAGQNSACNEGLLSWCRSRFAPELGDDDDTDSGTGPRAVQVIDERRPEVRPQDAEVSNIAEDTRNAVSWYSRQRPEMRPDIAIIAQLETTNAEEEATKLTSAVSGGGLLRARVRQQLGSGDGAFLLESRTGGRAPRGTGDALSDRVVATILRLENLSERCAYTFAPSVPTIQAALNRANFAAVSSAAIDPACFLGGWLKDAYLWDYDLPSYSSRAGDSNGYYLLSKIKEVDREGLGDVLRRLPDCKALGNEAIDDLILEVARRGIPTVRGLASGTSGASGDLGLFVAARVLQDEFRARGGSTPSLLPVWQEDTGQADIALVVPVDPFRGYIEDLGKSLAMPNSLRPDLIVVWIRASGERVLCKLTPVEVKFRGANDPMPLGARKEALAQARALSALLSAMKIRAADSEVPVWKVALQHFLLSMLNFGFRVYSQQLAIARRGAPVWAERHCRVVEALLAEEMQLEVDDRGRLIVIDASPASVPFDLDDDHFFETISLSHVDAASVIRSEAVEVYAAIRSRVDTWGLAPQGTASQERREEAGIGKGAGVSGAPEPAVLQVPPRTLTPVAPPGVARLAALPNGNEDHEGAESPASELQRAPERPASEGVQLFVGPAVDAFQPQTRVLDISNTDLNQLNMGVVGDLGTGKTQLLKSLIYQLVISKEKNFGVQPRILIFDYKRDYSAAAFVDATGARIVKPYRLPLNPFDLTSAGESINPRLDRFKFFSDVLDKLYAGIGPVQREHLKTAVMRAYGACGDRGPTIYDIHANYQSVTDGRADAVSSIIGDLVDMELFTPQAADVLPFGDFFDGVVVVSLDALGQDDRTKNMLVAIMLNMFYEHMLRTPKRPYGGKGGKQRTIDSFLLVDEADNIMRYEFDVLRKVLLQGREFGVGVILASQYLRHFKAGATDYREPLLTWFIHKVPNVLPQELGALGLTGDVASFANRIKSLAVHQCLFKTFGGIEEVVRGTPFFELPRS